MIALPRPACSRGSWDRGCPGIPEWVGWVRWVSHNSLRGFPDIPRRYSCARWVSQNLCPRMRWVSQNFPARISRIPLARIAWNCAYEWVSPNPAWVSPSPRFVIRMRWVSQNFAGGCPRIPEFLTMGGHARWVSHNSLRGFPDILRRYFCASWVSQNLCPRMRWVSHNFQEFVPPNAVGVPQLSRSE